MKIKLNKKASNFAERIIKMILILTGLLIIFVAARAYMMYQTGMSDSGVYHFFLENRQFTKNLDYVWSPSDSMTGVITFYKSGREIAVNKEINLNMRACPIVDVSKVEKKTVFDPAYGGAETGNTRFLNGASLKESDLALAAAARASSYLPDSKLTRNSDKEMTLVERLDVITAEKPGIVIGVKLSDDYEADNIVRIYLSSENTGKNRAVSYLLACSMINSFVENVGIEGSITGVSIMEIRPTEAYQKTLNGRPAVLLEVSNFNNDNAIEFLQSEKAAVAIQKGVEAFYSGKYSPVQPETTTATGLIV